MWMEVAGVLNYPLDWIYSEHGYHMVLFGEHLYVIVFGSPLVAIQTCLWWVLLSLNAKPCFKTVLGQRLN